MLTKPLVQFKSHFDFDFFSLTNQLCSHLNHKASNDNKLTITYYKLTQDRNNKTNFYKCDLMKTKKEDWE